MRLAISSLIAALTFLLLSCSGIVRTSHLEVIPADGFVRVRVHDWYEKETTGPSVGVYRPPIYAIKRENQLFVVYPILVVEHYALIGPPLIPFIPTGNGPNSDLLQFRVRHNTLKPLHDEAPVAVRFREDGPVLSDCPLEVSSIDSVGRIYSCELPEWVSETEELSTALELADGTVIPIEFRLRSDTMYSPLMSFNGPAPRPKLEIVESH